ncbi:MAG: hypothetical protein ABIL90_01930 [candidate division WOR-3 bacterium]
MLCLIFCIMIHSSLDSLLIKSIKRIEYGYKNMNLDTLEKAYKDLKYVSETRGKALDFYFTSLCLYRLYTLGFKKYLKEEYIDSAIYYLEKSVKIEKDFSDAYALLGSLYGMKAKGLFKGMVYGPKSEKNFKRAKEIDSLNPRVYYLEGISFLYKPKEFGGSVQKAIKNFKRAINIFEKGKGERGIINWGHLECMMFLGISYEKVDSLDKAENIYKKVLEIDPDYGWAKYRLYQIKNR